MTAATAVETNPNAADNSELDTGMWIRLSREFVKGLRQGTTQVFTGQIVATPREGSQEGPFRFHRPGDKKPAETDLPRTTYIISEVVQIEENNETMRETGYPDIVFGLGETTVAYTVEPVSEVRPLQLVTNGV